MSSRKTFAEKIVKEKLAVFTFNDAMQEPSFRRYFIKNWYDLTVGMKKSTILFLGGVHGKKTGQFGGYVSFKTLTNQFTPEVLNADWLLEDKEAREIKFEFINIWDFIVNEETNALDEDGIVSKIQSIKPQMTFLIICHSQTLDFKFLLERTGIFAEQRINRDLNILSNGQILTMNNLQKEFIQTMTHQDHVEKDVVVTGPVGSGKTLLGLEAINIKKSHYIRKYGISSNECQNKLRVLIVIGCSQASAVSQMDGGQLKQQLEEMSKSMKDCTLDIETKFSFNSEQWKEQVNDVFDDNTNYRSFSHTLIMLDEIDRDEMCKVSSEEDQNVDYIYVIRNAALKAVKANFKPLEVTETTVECNLVQRQRSSQQILDLADYLQMHQSFLTKRRYESSSSFNSDIIPLWIEVTNPNSVFDYFKDKFENNDVMVICESFSRYHLNDIKDFCLQQNWRCTEKIDVRGSEASITILYDLDHFYFEHFTRAKSQLIIVTIAGKQSELATNLQDIEKGHHDDKECEEYRKKYKRDFDQDLPDCEYKGNKSKIQKLIQKVQIDENGIVTEIQFDDKTNDEDTENQD